MVDEIPTDSIDYRAKGGPLLSYIWEKDLHGQELYLGAEIGCDNHVRRRVNTARLLS